MQKWDKEAKKLILDIGSGSNPRGNVNIDIPQSSLHRGNKPIKHISNFIYADAQALPFRNKTFSKILCHHVLEHIPTPLFALREMARVSKGIVKIIIPSEYNLGYGAKGHIYTWNHATLENLLEHAFKNIKVGYIERHSILGPNRLISRIFPFLRPLMSKLGLYAELYAEARN